jgi:hypothetical protein
MENELKKIIEEQKIYICGLLEQIKGEWNSSDPCPLGCCQEYGGCQGTCSNCKKKVDETKNESLKCPNKIF